MKNMIQKLINLLSIILCFIVLNSHNTFAQEVESYKKNSIYLTSGGTIFVIQGSISYERLLLQKKKIRTKGKFAYGNYIANGLDYDANATVFEDYFSISVVQLLNLLELNGGVAYAKYTLARGFETNLKPDIFYEKKRKKFMFYGNIGIRYVKNKFMIRAGIGNLELLYLGIGINL